MGALKDNMANIDVKGFIVFVFPQVVKLVHQLDKDCVSSPPVLQSNLQPVRSAVFSSLVSPSSAVTIMSVPSSPARALHDGLSRSAGGRTR